MAHQQGFPLDDFQADLEKLQDSLKRAEKESSKDKELTNSIRDAKAESSKVEKNLKSDR